MKHITGFCIYMYVKLYYLFTKNSTTSLSESHVALSYHDLTALDSCRHIMKNSHTALIDAFFDKNDYRMKLLLPLREDEEDFKNELFQYLSKDRNEIKSALTRKFSINNIPDTVINEFILYDIVRRILTRCIQKSKISESNEASYSHNILEMKISDVLNEKIRYDYDMFKKLLMEMKGYDFSKNVSTTVSRQYDQLRGLIHAQIQNG